ncbi:MAG: DUF1501 domain-containing protein [Pirellulaceae bacterium]|nr:hypothetical protein [Planctomycetaceae bacterium]MDP6466106.1 DUF1501 domain-containing protein [Pirellulaceae bacterium]MDP6554436.1 DUF1501 domain-containing protein [Pirellulaceae bacterium]
MKCSYTCRSSDHLLARRQFMGTLAGGTLASGAVVGGLSALAAPDASKQLAKNQKRVLVVNMAGGLSQLESWDPKPATNTGGPFRAIATTVPGTQICELLPKTARQMHHLSLVRSINTKENDHGKGQYLMQTGRRRTPAGDFPRIGAVAAKALNDPTKSLPGHIVISAGGSGGRSNDAAYLGPEFASVSMGNGKPPQNTDRPAGVSETSELQRHAFRRRVNDRFALRRRTAMTDAYMANYEQALELMKQRDVFDVSKEPQADLDRYGKHDFGRHCLLARRLLENDITFVQVTHSNYDTHNENFNFHLEQLGEFDSPFATLVADLADRGMLESTLIIVLSEFGRTPNINQNYGRDHWGTAWSICLGGAGIQSGAVIGKTNNNGTKVEDREVDHGHLFHTYMQAVGVDSTGHFDIDGRAMPIADPSYTAIDELLS